MLACSVPPSPGLTPACPASLAMPGGSRPERRLMLLLRVGMILYARSRSRSHRVASPSEVISGATVRLRLRCSDGPVSGCRSVSVRHGWVVWICTVQKFRASASAPRFRAFGAKARNSVKSFAHLPLPRIKPYLLVGRVQSRVGRRAAPTCRLPYQKGDSQPSQRVGSSSDLICPWRRRVP